MTKTVFTNDQCIHVWAQQTQPYGENSKRSIHFNDATLYSYATPIAEFHTSTASDAKVVLISSKSFSNTTSKHVSRVRGATSQYRQFYVPTVSIRGNNGWGKALDHEVNLTFIVEGFKKLCDETKRIRVLSIWIKSNLHTRLHDIARKANLYATLFHLPLPSAMDAEKAAQEVFDYRATREAKSNTPANVAKRAKAAQARADHDARQQEAAKIEQDKQLQRFRLGEQFYGRLSDADGGALLRVKGNTVETSWGADVPLCHAVKLFRFVADIRDKGQDWDCGDQTIRVGHFTLTSVYANGSMRVGCHLVNWPEIEACARVAGVLSNKKAA